MNISEQKKALRAKVRRASAELDGAEKNRQSRSVVEQIEASAEFRRAQTVAAFWPLADEVQIGEAVARWAAVKRVVLPVVVGDEMVFRRYVPTEAMERGALNTVHPARGEEVDPGQIDLVIVPGMAFDRAGGRMGRGKGFYDRYLCRCAAPKMGVCLAHQIVDSVPSEPHDLKMDVVIAPATPKA